MIRYMMSFCLWMSFLLTPNCFPITLIAVLTVNLTIRIWIIFDHSKTEKHSNRTRYDNLFKREITAERNQKIVLIVEVSILTIILSSSPLHIFAPVNQIMISFRPIREIGYLKEMRFSARIFINLSRLNLKPFKSSAHFT